MLEGNVRCHQGKEGIGSNQYCKICGFLRSDILAQTVQCVELAKLCPVSDLDGAGAPKTEQQ